MDRAKARRQAEALVSQMTLEEKAGQLRYDAPAIPRLGVPAYNWWNEALHGVARAGTATSFPQAIALAASFDSALVEKLGDVAATEARAKYNAQSALEDRDLYKGLTFWSPNVNIFRDPRWGRGHETYGEDPFLSGQIGVAYIRGLQGNGETMKTAACAKHLAVHSGPEAIRHQFDARVTLKDLEETYLPAFETCVKAGVEAVMGAYNRVNGEPCCGSKTLLMDILRGRWGFQGHVVSDCWAIQDFYERHHITENSVQSAALALNMGCDLNCGVCFRCLLRAQREGLVTEQALTDAAVRVFTTRYLLGIMGEGSEYDAIPYEKVECPEHLELAQQAARESCVLLKNDGLLPLDRDKVGTVGVIGPNANSRAALVGNYHGTASRYVTVLEGIQDVMAGHGRVLYSEGCHLWKDRMDPLAQPGDRLSEAVTVAQHSDTVVLVLGLDETLEGEQGDAGNASASGDKADLLLPAPQRELLDRVLAVGKPTVVVLMAGSAIDLSRAQEDAGAILLSWYPGAGGGRAVAELLFGMASPSGKLPVTFYRDGALSELPDFTDYSMENRTYRYYRGEPLYPFGYGLTYGDVVLTELTASRTSARVTAENRGARATGEVVELYLRDNASPDAPANPILCGFLRLPVLAPGETRTLSVPIDPAAFTVVNAAGERLPGSGSWTLYAHTGQPDGRTARLTGRTALQVQVV